MKKCELELNDFEKMESGAEKIIKYFDARLAKLRVENDDPEADVATRGRIAEIKTFQSLLVPKKVIKTSKHVPTMYGA